MMIWILALVIAYCLGSIPFGYLLVRYVKKEDIRSIGSGNIGATNVTRSGAKGLGLLTLLLDALKGALGVWIAQFLGRWHGYSEADVARLAAAAALAAVVGHMFPAWLGFKGGKGVATALGVFLVLSSYAAMCAFCIFIVVVIFTQYVSLSSILSSLVLLVVSYYFDQQGLLVNVCYSIIVALVIVKHHKNISRMINGTEHKFTFTKRPKA